MAGRKTKPEINRRRYHQGRVDEAKREKSPKSELWAYCHWLVAEAWSAGPDQLKRTRDLIRNHIDELIKARREGAR